MSVRQPRFGDGLPPLVTALLKELGEDPGREGLIDTPDRVARSLRDLTEGYRLNAAEVIGDALFKQEYDEMVLVKGIQFYSLCEHHLLPFFGQAHVAYMPSGRVVGLSKVPRVVDIFSHRLQLQERLTRQIAESLETVLRPAGVAVVVQARHMCMEMRGVQRVGGETVTSCMLGAFRDDHRTRSEFLELIRT